MALFNVGEEPKIEISKIARSDIPLQKRSHIMLLRCSTPNTGMEPALPLQPSLPKLSSGSGKEQLVLPELMDSATGQGASGSDRARGGKSKFLSTDTEIRSTYPNPAPALRKKHIVFF